MQNNFFEYRSSGILLHITSLPSSYGIGDVGSWAYHFVDFLKATKQKFWQILPLNPTDSAYGNSPYSSISAFAANTLLISPDRLVKDGWIELEDLKPLPAFPQITDYDAVRVFKERLFKKAYQTFRESNKMKEKFDQFCEANQFWLDDFALFVVLKEHFEGKMWSDWPEELRDRNVQKLFAIKNQMTDKVLEIKFRQFLFFDQWHRLKTYCQNQGVHIIGDIPIYVNYDSADVWANPHLFKLNEEKRLTSVAGVPPDYFSKTGQRWGNPIYKWDRLQESSYEWWMNRFEHNLKIFDVVRIDHFRGLIAFWEIPAGEKTAVNGHWVDVEYDDFFNALIKKFPALPFIAEDLGLITPDVTAAMKKYGFPGMKILLFAFGDNIKEHPYIPENFDKNCVVYTGTHDNNTVRGWFENDMTEGERKNLTEYMAKSFSPEEISWGLIKLAMMSSAHTAITPIQDILQLGQEARMNTPSTSEKNWQWRLSSLDFSEDVRKKLIDITTISLRS